MLVELLSFTHSEMVLINIREYFSSENGGKIRLLGCLTALIATAGAIGLAVYFIIVLANPSSVASNKDSNYTTIITSIKIIHNPYSKFKNRLIIFNFTSHCSKIYHWSYI